MKIELTADTRPRMSSGVSSCIKVNRVTTLMVSAAPVTANATIERIKSCEIPNTTLAKPNTATAANMLCPTLR